MKKLFLFLCLLFLLPTAALCRDKTYTIQSPDCSLTVTIGCGDRIVYSVRSDTNQILKPSPLALRLVSGECWGRRSRVAGVRRYRIDEVYDAPVYKKRKVEDRCNGIVIDFREGFSLEFRAYDDAVAYRFVARQPGEVLVAGEEARFRFAPGAVAFVPYVRDTPCRHDGLAFGEQFMQSFENTYTRTPLCEMDSARLAFLPLLVQTAGGVNVCITDADLESYPGMFLHRSGADELEGVFAPSPRKVVPGGYDRMQGVVEEYEPFIASLAPGDRLPWRALSIVRQDTRLADNDLVWKLASPCRLDDISWIEPGKAAWEWWNDWGLSGVDFTAGINQPTYEYYIDFASRNGLRYLVLDDGWSRDHHSPLETAPGLDLPALVKYGEERGVGLILWLGYLPFAEQMEELCEHYSEMGIKGFKIDFMDRDDQEMVDFHYRAAEIAAKYKLMIDFHGTYKPTGLNRTYPNVINYEAVHGLEQMKWSDIRTDQVTYDVTMPFIRMLAGPVDYTQGAMHNANKRCYHSSMDTPMSQGTRCRQLAEYVVFESPLNMLCDSPTNYDREEECTEFIAAIPTVWEQTIAMNGEIGKYITMARRKGDVWYVGSLTNWDARTLTLDLSFLGAGRWKAEMFHDGVNANRLASDYQKTVTDIPASRKLTVKMAQGGGCALKIYKE